MIGIRQTIIDLVDRNRDPNNMAKPDEWVGIDEYLHIVRAHAIAAATYLTAGDTA